MNKLEEYQRLAREERGNAEFVAATLDIFTSVSKPINLDQIRQVFLDSAELPDDWAPEGESDFKMYLNTMVELGRVAGIDKMLPIAGTEDQYEVDPSTHERYYVKKLYQNVNSANVDKDGNPIPPETTARHKVIHIQKVLEQDFDDDGKLINERLVDIEVDHGLQLELIRTQGSKKTDKIGKSVWALNTYICHEDGSMEKVKPSEAPANYQPFLRTLSGRFGKKLQRYYGTKEIKDLILDLVKREDRLGLQRVSRTRGKYICLDDQINKVWALKQGLAALDDGIFLYPTELFRWPNDTPETNQALALVQDGLSDALTKELTDFIGKLDTHDDSDSTRLSTWHKREEELKGFRDKLERFHRKRLVNEKLLAAQYSAALQKVRDGIIGAISDNADPVADQGEQ